MAAARGVLMISAVRRWILRLLLGKWQTLMRCPFHDENTPSFVIDHKHQRFHCFGCGTQGDTARMLQLVRDGYRA